MHYIRSDNKQFKGNLSLQMVIKTQLENTLNRYPIAQQWRLLVLVSFVTLNYDLWYIFVSASLNATFTILCVKAQ